MNESFWLGLSMFLLGFLFAGILVGKEISKLEKELKKLKE